ncbi:MAG: lamin tail domain-containing protein [Bacteroidales bacterium]|nr:lamin tail domain-containing protein [Bacteroidales bacterium]
MNKFLTFRAFVVLAILSAACTNKDDPQPEPPLPVDYGLVINELMPVNSSVVADQNGEFDDWIELYNMRDTAVDLGGYFLSDSKSDVTKWSFPAGSVILPDSFLVVWADNDTLQSGLHANFKLSSAGETVVFSTPDTLEIDKVKYPAQLEQFSYSRIPNGTGDFVWEQYPTFNSRNIQKP